MNFSSLLRYPYNQTLRKWLPPKKVKLNGVDAYRGCILDFTAGDIPEYEAELCDVVESHTKAGDVVCVVGGGHGVSASYALNAGAGFVRVAEASAFQCERVYQTLQSNADMSRWCLLHATVGPANKVWNGDPGPSVGLSWVLGSDLLVLDCEGAEREILQSFDGVDRSRLPERVVVETHGCFGSPTGGVARILAENGYQITERREDKPDRDVWIIGAVKR